MVRIDKRRWLEIGLEALAEAGSDGLRIEALCRRLGLTKGSFYHHFAGRRGFVEDLLRCWEEDMTLRVIRLSDAESDPEARLRRLTELSVSLRPSRLEVAIRAWASQDPVVRSYVQRVDAARMAYLGKLVAAVSRNPEDNTNLARVFYSIFVGTQYIQPPIEGNDLYRLFRLVGHLYQGRKET